MSLELVADRVYDGRIHGWGWDSDRPDHAISVELCFGEAIVAATRAKFFRADVLAAGHGTGQYGFNLLIPLQMYSPERVFCLKVSGSTQVTSKTADGADLNAAIYKEIIQVFRDALQVILGKTEAGVEFLVSSAMRDLPFAISIDGQVQVAIRTEAVADESTDRLTVSVPRHLADGRSHDLTLLVGPISHGLAIYNASAILPIYKPLFRGYLEGLRGAAIAGWCVDVNDPFTPAEIEIYVDDQLRQIIRADLVRADLATVTQGGAGGFSWALPARLQDGRRHRINVVPATSDTALPRAESSVVFPGRQPPALHRYTAPEINVEIKPTGFGLQDATLANLLAGLTAGPDWVRDMPGLLRAMATRPHVTVVVPIYNAAADVQRCLQSLVRNTTFPCEILLIDDASPQGEIGPILDYYGHIPSIRVIRNQSNIGYTQTCNKAIATTSGDLVFLNSDTYVTPRWLERLVTAAYRRSDIATVTATSNRSGAFSVPEPYGANPTPTDITPEAYATLVSRVAGLNQPVVPTGNGFCMYVRRAAIAEVGDFDAEAFPRGYGEENDFCLRVMKAGWLNVIDDRSFVFHKRSASFGPEQPALQDAAQRVVIQRHPDYTVLTGTFSGDPKLLDMRSRVQALSSWLVQPRTRPVSDKISRPRVLYALHYNGEGGTALTTRDLVGEAAASFECFLLTTEDANLALDYWTGERWDRLANVPLDGPMDLIDAPRPDYEAAVSTLLLAYDISLLHVRHLIGHSLFLPRIASRLNIPVVMSFHDFYMVCPTVNLLDENGRYCHGVCTPGFGSCATSVQFLQEYEPLKHNYIYKWHDRVRTTFPYCDTFVTTSGYVRDLFYGIYPELREHDFRVIEHGREIGSPLSLAVPPSAGEPLRILILGNILQRHKGYEILQALKALDKSNQIEFHFLGAAPADAAKYGIVHGRYQRSELAERVAAIRPNVVGIFSIWAETYCHTLSEAWQLGIPVLGSHLGAIGERIAQYGGGWAVDCGQPAGILQLIHRLREDPEFWEIGRSSATTNNLRSTAAMAADYVEIYKRHLLPTQFDAGGVLRVILIGEKLDGEWTAASSLIGSLLRHPSLAARINLISTDIDGLQRGGFALDSKALLLIADDQMEPEKVDIALSIAGQRQLPARLISDQLLLPLFNFVDERNWGALKPDTRNNPTLRIAGRDLDTVTFLLVDAAEDKRAIADALVRVMQENLLAEMKVLRVSLGARDHSEIHDMQVGPFNEAATARYLQSSLQQCPLVVMHYPVCANEKLLLKRLGLMGIVAITLQDHDEDVEVTALEIAARLADLPEPGETICHTLAEVSIHANAEAIYDILFPILSDVDKGEPDVAGVEPPSGAATLSACSPDASIGAAP
jgi:GT2 family glycosyltransferase/glycosyltransferase involved in cell wall biosynthesis